jgi:hypothetical protein
LKYPKKHKTTNPKHQEDYVFVEKPGEDFTAIKLISGPYADIDSQEFINHIGDILVVLLDDNLKEKKELDGKNRKNST